jgi:Cof subfamily protein (haloacid dehalogenase superfamily)
MKVIFLDADGTLLHSDGHIPESAIKACQLAQQKGHKICLGTGRQIVEIIGDLTKIDFDACICGSGSTVLIDKKIVQDSNFDESEKEKIETYFFENNVPIIVEDSHGLFSTQDVVEFLNGNLDQLCAGLSLEEKQNHSLALVIQQIHVVDHETLTKLPFNKIAFLNSSIPVQNIIQKFSNTYDVIPSTYAPYGPMSGELTRKNITKANGIDVLAKYYHVSKDDIISIGDNYNDLPMFEKSGFSIAMGNSVDEVKKQADYVTDDILQDGIYNAFKKLNII